MYLQSLRQFVDDTQHAKVINPKKLHFDKHVRLLWKNCSYHYDAHDHEVLPFELRTLSPRRSCVKCACAHNNMHGTKNSSSSSKRPREIIRSIRLSTALRLAPFAYDGLPKHDIYIDYDQINFFDIKAGSIF